MGKIESKVVNDMKFLSYRWFLLPLIMLSFHPLSIADANINKGEQREQDKGWFMYNEEPVPVEKEEKKKKEPVSSAKPKESKFTAKWFRENLDKYRDMAIDQPTEKNILQYEVLQRIMMERSFYYARKTVEVMQKYPKLDGSNYLSNTNTGYLNSRINADKTKTKLLKRFKNRFGLWFFFDDSEMSISQAKSLNYFKSKYEFEVFPINTGSTPLPYNLFPDAKQNAGHAEKLGVLYFPAVILVDAEKEKFYPISFNFVNARTLGDMVLRQLKVDGLINLEEWEMSQSGGRVNPFMEAVVDMSTGVTNYENVDDLVSRFSELGKE